MTARTPSGAPTTVFTLQKSDYSQLAKLYPEAGTPGLGVAV